MLGFGNNALPFALITWGQTHLASGLASILIAATPLFTVLAAHVLTAEEKLSGLKLFGTLAGMAGVAWLIGPDMLFGGAIEQCVGGTRAFSRRRCATRCPPFTPGACVLLASSRSTSPPDRRQRRPCFSRRSRSSSTSPGPFLCQAAPVVASVLAIAAFSTALAFIVYFRILAGAGATNVLLVTLLTPATAVILGALFLHERLMAHQFLGFALIAVGLAFIDGRLPRALFGARDNPNPASGNSRLPIGEKSR